MTGMPDDRTKWLKFGLVALAVAVVALAVWSVVPSAIYFGVFDHVVGRVVEATGWSRNLVRGFTVLALIPFVWAVSYVLGLRLRDRVTGMFRPTPAARLRRVAAQGIIVLYFASYFFLMYLVYRDTAFVTVDGNAVAVRWVAFTPEGCEFFEEAGVHRKYGTPLQPVTPEIIAKCDQINSGDAPRPVIFQTVDEVEFFDPIRGTPLVYYYERPDGRIELFSRPGVHPIYGAPLRAANADIIEQLRGQVATDRAARAADDERVRKEEVARQQGETQRASDEAAARHRAELERQRRRYMAPSVGGLRRAAVVVSSGRLQVALTERLAEAVGARFGVLSDAFIADGLLGDVMRADYARLRSVELERELALVVVADVRSGANSAVVGGETVFKGTAQLRVVVLRPSDGYSAESFSVDGSGAGFSAEVAEQRALDQAADGAVSKLARYR